jgi:hypothetical protein
MADERDPIAAMNNATGKHDEDSDSRERNFTDAFEAPDRQGVIGPGDPEGQHRAPLGEGVRAPLAQESGGKPQYSSFDGSGNERVVVLTENEKGQPIKASGPDAASAQESGEKSSDQLGDMGYGKPSGRAAPSDGA